MDAWREARRVVRLIGVERARGVLTTTGVYDGRVGKRGLELAAVVGARGDGAGTLEGMEELELAPVHCVWVGARLGAH